MYAQVKVKIERLEGCLGERPRPGGPKQRPLAVYAEAVLAAHGEPVPESAVKMLSLLSARILYISSSLMVARTCRGAADYFQLHAVGRGWACTLCVGELELLADLSHQGGPSGTLQG